ncbi:transmembrane protein 267 [Parasteatoda tepidariorum]|uniref:transmembrane protein 267 n=1 Tax=Parasteatoda tepidariorum TaxID=114398 RepID=UPI001C71E622|nr:transmembrane protein 267 [Parasteatoda tepidariorum]
MYINFICKQFIFIAILFSISKSGDSLSQMEMIQKNLTLHCFIDNLTHIAIGIISWLIVISYDKISLSHLLQSLLCGFFAGIIDVDHFLMAKSLNLKDAVSLPSRPPFHNTTLLVSIVTCFIILMHNIEQKPAEKIGWFMLVAVVSHHLRDAMRRGLWLWPFETKPLGFCDSVIISYLFSLGVGALIKIIDHPVPKEKTAFEV